MQKSENMSLTLSLYVPLGHPGPEHFLNFKPLKLLSLLAPDDLDPRFERALTVRVQQTQGRYTLSDKPREGTMR